MGRKNIARRARFSILYNLWGIGLFLLLDFLILSGAQPPAIAYGDFLHRVASGQVASVAITSDHIYGVMKPVPEVASTKPAPRATVPRGRRR